MAMETGRLILCILGAMVGAGLASGREIMRFFTQYGPASQALILLSCAVMTALMARLMRRGRLGLGGALAGGTAGKILFWTLLLGTGGGMTAAAGELFALTLPLRHARSLGMLCTLLPGLLLARRSLTALECASRLLLPLLLAAILLCLRKTQTGEIAASETPAESLLLGALQALCYAGMNVLLSAEVLCEAGARCDTRTGCRGAAWCGGALCGILLLFNEALLRGPMEARQAELPMVLLLRGYGKAGFYLSAAVLYLAVITTLFAVLRAQRALAPDGRRQTLAGAATLLTALCGFERTVSVIYPVLGFFSLLMICWPQRKKKAVSGDGGNARRGHPGANLIARQGRR